MLTRDNLYTGAEGREKLMNGIRKAAQAVGSTMGTGGSNSLIEAIASPGHLSTNDGATILDSIRLADPIEEMGRKVLVEAVSRANKASGDGSSTTTVLTAAILEEGQKHLEEAQAMEIKRSLEACIPVIEEGINSQKREITVEEVAPVASISAEDEEIGNRIAEIYQKIGKNGIIYWDISKTTEDTYTIGTGITVNGAGYFSPYMCDITSDGRVTNQIRIKNARIVVTKQAVKSAQDFENLAVQLNQRAIKDVVVFCDDIDPLVVPNLIATRTGNGFRIVLVKMPILWKDEWYEDIAKASGATLLDPTAGIQLKDITMEHVGSVKNIIITKEDTFIDGIQDVSAHLADLEAQGTDEAKHRVARLNTSTARYFVGAQSDSALSYRRLKVEDAISAAYQALQNGVVIGGGIALTKCIPTLPATIGGHILSHALLAPKEQIEKNMNTSLDEAKLATQQVYDPVNVVLNAARNAISVAAAVLTTETIVVLPREEQFRSETPL